MPLTGDLTTGYATRRKRIFGRVTKISLDAKDLEPAWDDFEELVACIANRIPAMEELKLGGWAGYYDCIG